ncbi:MAG: hypothetical protein EP338_05940 [Bacteroidetes bacterium]|nr:MAG: hypothetical protein EP338_05940 [Bacteroidota bacterium]
MFAKRKVVIATMHQKERVIAPILKDQLGLESVVAEINTDLLGTFSGETERLLSPIDAARQKCRLAMEITSCDLAIASEGSFGQHPSLFFAQADDEIVLMMDRENNLEIFGRELTTDTNISGAEIDSLDAAFEFARSALFPDHGLILKDKESGFSELIKGITSTVDLERHVKDLLQRHKSIWLETDMRALFNPKRMKAIEKATKNLVQKACSCCPKCHFPGYWIQEFIPGLPCSHCHYPTRSTLAHRYTCKNCMFSETKYFPQSKNFEDPTYCDVCNP